MSHSHTHTHAPSKLCTLFTFTLGGSTIAQYTIGSYGRGMLELPSLLFSFWRKFSSNSHSTISITFR